MKCPRCERDLRLTQLRELRPVLIEGGGLTTEPVGSSYRLRCQCGYDRVAADLPEILQRWRADTSNDMTETELARAWGPKGEHREPGPGNRHPGATRD